MPAIDRPLSACRYGVGVMLALMLMHLRREPDGSATTFLSNGVPDVNNKTARPVKMVRFCTVFVVFL